jgi:hypothetical protein
MLTTTQTVAGLESALLDEAAEELARIFLAQCEESGRKSTRPDRSFENELPTNGNCTA